MENTKTFNFVLGEETRPKIESFYSKEDIKNSIFFEQYKKALECIADFVVQSSDANNNINKSDNANFTQQQAYNNLFVFIGDRGSGKTSCMLTINDIITHKNNHNNTISSIFETISTPDDNCHRNNANNENESLELEEKRKEIRKTINEHYQNVIDIFAEYTF